jgi:hypothetical protein
MNGTDSKVRGTSCRNGQLHIIGPAKKGTGKAAPAGTRSLRWCRRAVHRFSLLDPGQILTHPPEPPRSQSHPHRRPRRRTAKGPEEESVERRRDGGKNRPYIHPSYIHPSHVHTRTENAEFVSRVIGHGSCVIDVRSAPSFLLPERQKPVGRGTNGRSTLIPVAPYH